MQAAIGWIAAEPTVGRDFKQKAGIKGEVDDNTAFSFLLGLVEIIHRACHATTFSDPQKAVEWYRRSFAGVDCIVLDMNMPVMDGKACFAAMRKINPRARAIFSTGFMVGDTAAIIRMPGIRGYVQKPFTLEGLVLAITQAVDGEDINSADS